MASWTGWNRTTTFPNFLTVGKLTSENAKFGTENLKAKMIEILGTHNFYRNFAIASSVYFFTPYASGESSHL